MYAEWTPPGSRSSQPAPLCAALSGPARRHGKNSRRCAPRVTPARWTMRALPMQSNPMQSIPTSPRVVSSSVWSACGFEASIEPLLVARAAGGEHGAFGLLYQRHVDRVYQYVFFRVRNADLAEDLTQEIFISAYRAIAGLQHADRFVPWLLTIARNRLLNHWRAAQRTADAVRPDDIDDALADVAGEDELSALEARVATEALIAGAARLTDLQHDVLGLRFVSGLSVAETAAIMGRSESAVKNLQHHALKALRFHLLAQADSPQQAETP